MKMLIKKLRKKQIETFIFLLFLVQLILLLSIIFPFSFIHTLFVLSVFRLYFSIIFVADDMFGTTLSRLPHLLVSSDLQPTSRLSHTDCYNSQRPYPSFSRLFLLTTSILLYYKLDLLTHPKLTHCCKQTHLFLCLWVFIHLFIRLLFYFTSQITVLGIYQHFSVYFLNFFLQLTDLSFVFCTGQLVG